MANQDHGTHYVEKRTAGGAGWFIAGGLVVALIIGGLLYTNGYFGGEEDVSIEFNVPGLGS
ncbi:MAG: hypothetical protein Tsb0019_28930 [Roseibium sp.]